MDQRQLGPGIATMFDTEREFDSARGPCDIPKGADGSKRQILSAIDPTSLQGSNHGHGTNPNHSTTHFLRQ